MYLEFFEHLTMTPSLYSLFVVYSPSVPHILGNYKNESFDNGPMVKIFDHKTL